MGRSAESCLETALEAMDRADGFAYECIDKCKRDYVDALDGALALIRKAKKAMRDVMDMMVMEDAPSEF